MKSRSLFAAIFLAVLLLSFQNVYAFGLGDLPGVGGGGSAPSGNAGDRLDKFIKNSAEAAALLKSSVNLMARAVASKEEIEQIEAGQKAIKEAKSPEEKEAAEKKLQADEVAILKKTSADQLAEAAKKEKDKEKAKNLGAAAFNFALVVIKDVILAKEGKEIVSSVSSNPMLITKLGKVKDFISDTGSQIDSLQSISGKLPKLFSVTNVKAPVDASAAPLPVKESSET